MSRACHGAHYAQTEVDYDNDSDIDDSSAVGGILGFQRSF